MKVNNIKAVNKGIIVAKCDIEFENWGITVRDCTILSGKNGKWVNFPSRQYEQDGQKKYFSYIYMEKEKKAELDRQVIEKIDKEMANTQRVEPNFNDDECPF